jgi:hypothetical protein
VDECKPLVVGFFLLSGASIAAVAYVTFVWFTAGAHTRPHFRST